MGQDPGTSGTELTGAGDTEQLRDQIEETRQELGDTVEALAVKTDVKAQAKRAAKQHRGSLGAVAVGGIALLAGLIGWHVVQHRRGGRKSRR